MHFVTFILKNLTRRPIRTALTVLGLAVTVGSMIAFLAVSHNVKESAERAVRGFDLQVMQAGKSSGLNSDFSEYFVEAARKLPEVSQVAEGVADMADMTRDGGAVDAVLIFGWRADNFAFDELKFTSGRKFEAGEHHKVMLGNMLADNLGKKVGDKLVLGGDTKNPYEVIGIYESPHIFERGGAIVPYKDAQVITGKRDRVTGFSVRVRKAGAQATPAEVEAARKKIEALEDPNDTTARLTAQTPEDFVKSLQQLKLMRAVSWLISAIALAIGVISMLNTMAMSVLERTQEIGILRAVGWPPRRVIGMVLGEAVLIATAAAAGGTLIALLGMQVLTLSPKVNGFIEPNVAPMVVVQGALITVFIGVIGGAYPAFRASRMLPTEALRHD
ncbi:putative ABC transporter permease YknZ [Gemmata sp. SH-PL17]|uniref:ABC transporter permease n=1 Tax=Gemmata sp. SH-PL17 TaxID=1630693 RepID=UPI00078B9159|nr:ABC transporter permease [Gemmata sp. SH-PL17]AMV24409.1 putative ABC transporter permease YknZ [Gemmata sp. SH-PL17]